MSLAAAHASHFHGFSYCRAWALGVWASVVVAHGFSCPLACGIFLEQGWNHVPFTGRWIPNHWTTSEVFPLDSDNTSSRLSSISLVRLSQLLSSYCTRLCDSPKPTHLLILPLEYSLALNYPILSMSPLVCGDRQLILVPLSSNLYLSSVKYEHFMLF